jgi:hypothetical protein
MRYAKTVAILLLCAIVFSLFVERAYASIENQVVDDWDETYVAWTEAGTDPFLNSDDGDTSYVATNTANALEGYFTFADTTFTTITDVHLWATSRFVTATSENYIGVYNSSDIAVGLIAPVSTSYALAQVDSGVLLNYLDTPAKVNAFKVYFKFFRILSSTRTIRVTYLYINITGTTGGAETYTTTSNLGVTVASHNKPTIDTVTLPSSSTFTISIHNKPSIMIQPLSILSYVLNSHTQLGIMANAISNLPTLFSIHNKPNVQIQTRTSITVIESIATSTIIKAFAKSTLPFTFATHTQIATIINTIQHLTITLPIHTAQAISVTVANTVHYLTITMPIHTKTIIGAIVTSTIHYLSFPLQIHHVLHPITITIVRGYPLSYIIVFGLLFALIGLMLVRSQKEDEERKT